jgi:hypothetical protein
MQPAAHPTGTPAGSWRVSRDGAPIAVVGIRRERDDVVVAAKLEGAAGKPRPYRFGTVEDADAFIGDLMTSFAYLGCDITRD